MQTISGPKFKKFVDAIVGTCTSTVDNISGDENIANLFAGQFKELYNSVPSGQRDITLLENDLKNRITTKCCSNNCSCTNQHSITLNDVQLAVNKF